MKQTPANFSSCLSRIAAAALCGTAVLSLAGCGGTSAGTAPAPILPVLPAPGLTTGTVQSGTQPIAGATIQLYSAGTTGNGSAPTPLLTTVLLSDATGAFTLPAYAYACPTSTSQLYLVSRGGKLPSASVNSAITFLTTMGPCNQFAATSHFFLNEVTTVANAWALAQFLGVGANLGSSATNAVGLANAIATAASLVNPLTGTAPGADFPANGTAPTRKLNSLANLLNSCLISNAAATACASLISSSSDTLDTALKIVRSPAADVAALYTRSIASSAFSPALDQAPADWTLFVNFTGAGMNSPANIALDSAGNLWIANYFNVASKLSPTGHPIFAYGITGSGLTSSYGMAVDAHDNAWIANESSPSSVNAGLGSVTVLNPAGQPLSGATGFTAGGIKVPISIAIDPNASSWVLNFGNFRLTQLSASGAPLSGATGYSSPSFAFPVALAVDGNHNVWVANQSGTTVIKVSANGGSFTDFACCNGASGIAIDQVENVWAANYYGDSVSQISSRGSVVSNGYTSNGSISHPQGIAIDGRGTVWVANFRAAYLTQLSGATPTFSPGATALNLAPGQPISPPAGWAPDSNLFGAFSLAIDASGNVWVSNFNNNSITEFIGLAAPVKTPLLGPPQNP